MRTKLVDINAFLVVVFLFGLVALMLLLLLLLLLFIVQTCILVNASAPITLKNSSACESWIRESMIRDASNELLQMNTCPNNLLANGFYSCNRQ